MNKYRGVVMIPAFDRPEFLALTLEYIQKADHAKEYTYHIQLDKDYDEACLDILQKFGVWYTIDVNDEKLGCGNSHNILSGLNTAYIRATILDIDTIHLIEEDVWVAKDYFLYHEMAHEQFSPLIVSACINQHLATRPHEISDGVYKAKQYQSLGVSFRRDFVAEILLHDCNEYYNNLEKYCQTMFPNSKFGSLFAEQDGLIWRILEAKNESMIYPCIPRAYHAGYYSYHRMGEEPIGTLKEKIEQLRSMSDSEMNNKSFYKDIRSCDLDSDRSVTKLVMKEFP